MMWHNLFIWGVSVITVTSALCVILQKNPVVSALFLVGTFLGLGCLYLSLDAPFIAALQIIIYAGAITVLFIFVMMLLNLRKDSQRFSKFRVYRLPRYALLFTFLWVLFTFIHLTVFPIASITEKSSFSTLDVATLLFSKYFFPFELASFLLLIAMIGGVVLAKKRTPS